MMKMQPSDQNVTQYFPQLLPNKNRPERQNIMRFNPIQPIHTCSGLWPIKRLIKIIPAVEIFFYLDEMRPISPISPRCPHICVTPFDVLSPPILCSVTQYNSRKPIKIILVLFWLGETRPISPLLPCVWPSIFRPVFCVKPDRRLKQVSHSITAPLRFGLFFVHMFKDIFECLCVETLSLTINRT